VRAIRVLDTRSQKVATALLIKLGAVLVLAVILVGALVAGRRLLDGLGLLAPVLALPVTVLGLVGIQGQLGWSSSAGPTSTPRGSSGWSR
jgi:hypothetical protein